MVEEPAGASGSEKQPANGTGEVPDSASSATTLLGAGTTAAEPSATGSELLRWSEERPGWQRSALHRMATGVPIDAVVARAVAQCAGRQCDPSTGLPQAEPDSEVCDYLVAEDLPAAPGHADATHLLAIRDCHDVDAIAPGQCLEFAPTGLTVIYGDNGTGKSSYARLLRSIGTGAGVGEQVEGHAFVDNAPDRSAVLEYIGPEGSEHFAWAPGAAAPPPLGDC